MWKIDVRSTTDTSHAVSVVAKHVVLAGNTELSAQLNALLHRSVTPVWSYVIVTEPLSEAVWESSIGGAVSGAQRHMIVDDRFAMNYYRRLSDNRLLWGGTASTRPVPNDQIAALVRRQIKRIYPQLSSVQIDYAWGGAMGFSAHKMPLIGRLDGMYYCTAFAGHGLVPTSVGGEAIACAITGQDGGDQLLELFASVCPIQYAGWPISGWFVQAEFWRRTIRDAIRWWRENN